MADDLVVEVMAARGYPVDDPDERTGMVVADHPELAEDYRSAHAIRQRSDQDGASVDELREGFQHYRALFGRLVDDTTPGSDRAAAAHADEAGGDREGEAQASATSGVATRGHTGAGQRCPLTHITDYDSSWRGRSGRAPGMRLTADARDDYGGRDAPQVRSGSLSPGPPAAEDVGERSGPDARADGPTDHADDPGRRRRRADRPGRRRALTSTRTTADHTAADADAEVAADEDQADDVYEPAEARRRPGTRG